jgi:putative zinc finger protein
MDNSHRDRTIESLLRRREIDASQPTDQCVDAESLAAWMEGGLSDDAGAAVEKHAAGCARCQALLASMSRTAPDVEVRPWWRSVTAKWLIPVAASATALVVWISVGREPVPSMTQPAPPVEASRPANPPANPAAAPLVPLPETLESRTKAADKPSTQFAQSADAARARQELDKKLDRRADDQRLAAAVKPKPSAATQPVVRGGAGEANDALRPQGQMTADSSARSAAPPPLSAPAPAAAPPATAAPAPQPVNAAPAEAKPTPVAGLAESVGVSREVLAKQRAAGVAGTTAVVEIPSPDPNYRWRILPPTAVQRSTDGGTTWSIVDPLRAAFRAGAETPIVLTAGSSPSRDVCWIVGRAGTVLLSTNGATSQRRPFPETVDLTAVRATSMNAAIVTAADGRQFATTDGGATWVLAK